MGRTGRRAHYALAFLLLLASFGNLGLCPTTGSAAVAPFEGFANPALRARWQMDDGAATQRGTWLWGPGPFATNYEPYSGTPGGSVLAQYFDKGRMEVADPNGDQSSPWFVNSGLLVKEMVTGEIDTGGGQKYRLGPAQIAVAGDGPDNSGTTYATYAHFATLMGRAPNREGQPLPGNSYLRTNGPETEIVAGMNFPVQITLARYEQASGHNWAGFFWQFATRPNRPAQFDWLRTLGYPITEPYWIIVRVNGQQQAVLVQLFERRALTFNPANTAASQVEMGNVGRHYYQWRYADMHLANLKARYDVQIGVGAAPQRLTTIREAIQLTNATGASLDTVVLHAPWHHWDGVLTLDSASAQGRPAQTSWLQGINLEVSLPQAVPPGQGVALDLNLSSHPRPVGGRTGYDKANDILCLGDFIPAVVPWENGGWAIYPYSDLGDLGYYATSDYTVTVSSAGGERLIVGGTGTIEKVSADRTTWQFSAPNVRDAAYVVSPKFINPLDDGSMARKVGNVQVLAYFLPSHRSQGQRQLDLVTAPFAWYNSAIGAYPFATYTISEMGVPVDPTDNYAQEYPMDYFIPTSWLPYDTSPGRWTWYTPAHEVGHQWFYSTVGNNQLTDPWLDEAMTTYITAEYVRANFSAYYSQSWAGMTAGASGARPVSSSVFSGFINENQYTYAVYDTAVVMLNQVRQQMGDSAFYAALRDYYQMESLRIAAPRDLLATLQKHTQADLSSIFSQYMAHR